MKSNVNKEYTTSLGSQCESKEPTLYQVILKKDDFTPVEFLVSVLEKFFYMDRRRAAEVMLEVRTQGSAVCGLYSKDFAESKVYQIIEYAELHEHPLVCSMEAA